LDSMTSHRFARMEAFLTVNTTKMAPRATCGFAVMEFDAVFFIYSRNGKPS